jgi:hypothetical protein
MSRRRCALCFGLHRNAQIKRGQIAHVDGDRTNNAIANLVYLCLEHHEEYDSTSRQAKGITPTELKKYRSELQVAIESEWAKAPPIITPTADPWASRTGHYVLEDGANSAEFQINHLGNGVMQVTGFGLWQGQTSANSGSLDFVSELRENRLYFADRAGNDWYNLELQVGPTTLQVVESSASSYHGMNVTFAGTYHRGA